LRGRSRERCGGDALSAVVASGDVSAARGDGSITRLKRGHVVEHLPFALAEFNEVPALGCLVLERRHDGTHVLGPRHGRNGEYQQAASVVGNGRMQHLRR
jgi:hypothetical protein